MSQDSFSSPARFENGHFTARVSPRTRTRSHTASPSSIRHQWILLIEHKSAQNRKHFAFRDMSTILALQPPVPHKDVRPASLLIAPHLVRIRTELWVREQPSSIHEHHPPHPTIAPPRIAQLNASGSHTTRALSTTRWTVLALAPIPIHRPHLLPL